MSFRLPAHLDALVPAPAAQLPPQMTQPQAWRGVLSIPTPTGPDARIEICLTGAETDGDCRFDLWPTQLDVWTSSPGHLLADTRAWVKRDAPPLCMFMPDRLPDPAQHARNTATFRSFCQVLADTQCAALVPWPAHLALPGAGLVLFPPGPSTTVLTGAVLLTAQFPQWLIPQSVAHLFGAGAAA